MRQFTYEHWQEIADYVLPVLLAEETEEKTNHHFWLAVGEYGLCDYHLPPGHWRDTFNVVNGLIQNQGAVHYTTVAQEMGNGAAQHIAQWFTLYRNGSTLRGHVFETNVKQLMDLGERAQMIGYAEQMAGDLASGREIDSTVAQTMSRLAQVGTRRIEGATANELADQFRFLMDTEPTKHMQTGIGIIDSWIGSIGEGDMLSIAAPMKQRKTTLLLNMMLTMARRDLSVALLMFENTREYVTAQLVAMLATEYLIRSQLYGRNIVGDSDRVAVELIKPDDLLKLRARYKRWDKARVCAVDYGIAEFRKIEHNFRIYDRRHDGLSSSATILRVALRDKALHKTDFMGIDHAQRVAESGSDYEKMGKVVPFVETLARQEGIAVCLLAQLTAAKSEGVGDSHMTGVRGGTMLDEAVDYMLTTGYRQKSPDGERYGADKLIVGLHLSRYGDGGAHKRALVDIAPNSGLILNQGAGTLIEYKVADND